jgi:hypothetical protein
VLQGEEVDVEPVNIGSGKDYSLGGTPALARELEGVLLTPAKLAVLAGVVCLGFLASFALGLFVGFLVFRAG